ncbi:spermidine/putrescine ABC transporter substrate-binding protein [Arthrobacter koreensis]|uniref:Spermidine/putrescine ABC transporter substrate-binding protein n=1 Tax=Arthrobacter koreensis TaxID=199136 RepID=A0ABY6FVY6_9MICC|nr:spermidine/putrescine ABC transporter substrate-binding protein [Arthrobacter koreensis]MEB7448295.1 spermidine/putrescine ABC transporter substrate-binding protein [Arthrobacter koreensis]UYB36896.1 spermidine/putrescine ABC transporter substrate-binding protein [Arthrobacter koreensis]
MSKRPVNDPMLRSIVNAQLSRRKLLMGAGGLSLAGMLAACGTGGGTGGSASSKPSPATDVSDTDKIVNWANWTLYLDYDDSTRTYPSLEAFSEATGITANYSEDVDGNDTYFGKVQGQLSSGQDIGQDIVTLTDWMAARLIRLGYTQELDLANIPNSKNLLQSLQNVDFDPGRKHSLTWQTGFAGIAWNKEAFPQGLKTVSDLWQPELKGRVEVLDEMRDTMGLLMLDQGVDITGEWGEDEFENALDILSKQIADGQIRQVKGNSYKEDLISGDALAVIGWSGDITQLNFEEGDKWEFAIPDAGGTLWSDNLLVPIGATHKTNAEKLMDYYYDPVNAATVAAYVNYVCPVEGAREAMEAIDPELVENPLIFPTDEFLANTHVVRTLTPDEETDFSDRFQTAIGN